MSFPEVVSQTDSQQVHERLPAKAAGPCVRFSYQPRFPASDLSPSQPWPARVGGPPAQRGGRGGDQQDGRPGADQQPQPVRRGERD